MHKSVEDWLKTAGVGEHAQTFADNQIDLEAARDLNEDDLRELGIPMGPRKKLLRAIAALSSHDSTHEPESIGPPESQTREVTETPAERRQVTVLFADICGYTKLANELGAEATHAMLSAYFDEADAVVERLGGSVDKHIGDSVMAVFGAPISYGNDAERAVRAALAIHQAAKSVSQKVGRDIEVHIGLACGQVVASGVGEKEKYTVTGDSVNLASRLTDQAGPNETVISDRVKEAVESSCRVDDLGELRLKGILDPIHAFRVVGLELGVDRSRDKPFVGRKAELGQLHSVLSTTMETRSGHVIYLRGEAGIGKTRITEEVAKTARSMGFDTHRALVLDFGVGKSQDAVRSLVRSLLRLTLSSSKDEILFAVEQAAEKQIVTSEQLVFLNEMTDLPQPPEMRSLLTAMDNHRRNQGKGEAVASMVRNISKDQGLVLIVEDVHWAEPVVLQHLAEIARSISDAPVVMVMTSRLEGDQITDAWKGAIGSTPIINVDLRPLRHADAKALASDFLDATGKFAETCIERANGNPLFLEQLLRGAEAAAQSGVPGSIQSIVQARVDALGPSDKAAIQAAAILGQRFAAETLQFIVGDETYDCSVLLARHLIRSDGDVFLFAHALVRDGVYNSLLTHKRVALHKKAAQWFRDRDPILHAQHLDRADDDDAAAAYLVAARSQADALHFETVLQFGRRGLELVTDQDVQSDLNYVVADALLNIRATEDAIGHFESAVASAPDNYRRTKALAGLAAALRIADRQASALDALQQAQELASAEKITSELAYIHYLRGNLYFPLGRIEECMTEHERSLQLAEQLKSPLAKARALSGLADAHYLRGHMLTASERFTHCVDLCREHGFGQLEVANLHMIGWSQIHLMKFREVLEIALTSASLATEVRNNRSMMFSKKLVGSMYYYLGDFEKSVTFLEESTALSDSMGSANAQAQSLRQLAMAKCGLGDFDAARKHAEDAVKIVRRVGMTFIGPTVLAVSASLIEDPAARRALLEEAETILDTGCVAHNQLWFADAAIDTALYHKDWAAALRYADRLERATSSEPLAWSDFMVRRARALVAAGQGNDDSDITTELEALKVIAEQAGVSPSLNLAERAYVG